MTTDNSSPVTTTWLVDEYLVMFTIKNNDRETIDQWMAITSEVINAWPESHTFLAVHDFSGTERLFTPYTRNIGVDLFKMGRHLKGRLAIVMPKDNFALQMLRLILRGLGNMDLATQIFFTVDEAKVWLEALLPAEIKDSLPQPDDHAK